MRSRQGAQGSSSSSRRPRMAAPTQRQFKDFYDKRDLIGRGAFGEALTVKRLSDGEIFIMKKEKIDVIEKRKRKDEVNALKRCSHQNIVQYVDDFIDENYSRIIMEYCSEGDLNKYLRAQQGSLLSTLAVHNWTSDLAAGMVYLKAKKIVHRDLVLYVSRVHSTLCIVNGQLTNVILSFFCLEQIGLWTRV